MNALKVRELVLQPGRPKVAVPIIAAEPVDIINACEKIKELPCDIIEWRADYYLASLAAEEQAESLEKRLEDKNIYLDIVKILDDMEYIAAGKPIIFTIRSTAQGGEIQLTRPQLESIYGIVAQSGLADFVDIELYDKEGVLHEEWIRQQIEELHKAGGRVILSHHDFDRMPAEEEIVKTIKVMHRLGADICKAAAMADSEEDAKTLMKASAVLTQQDVGPLIMLAMGDYGRVTRIAGGRYGSCITFASAGEASAPGQIDVHTMQKWLDGYYKEG